MEASGYVKKAMAVYVVSRLYNKHTNTNKTKLKAYVHTHTCIYSEFMFV